jgi:hypothetical protein
VDAAKAGLTAIAIDGITHALGRSGAIAIALTDRHGKVVVKLSHTVRPEHHPRAETLVPVILSPTRAALGLFQAGPAVHSWQFPTLHKVEARRKVDGVGEQDLSGRFDRHAVVSAFSVKGESVALGAETDGSARVIGDECARAVWCVGGRREFTGSEGFQGRCD